MKLESEDVEQHVCGRKKEKTKISNIDALAYTFMSVRLWAYYNGQEEFQNDQIDISWNSRQNSLVNAFWTKRRYLEFQTISISECPLKNILA